MDSFQVKLNYEDALPPTRGSDEAAGYDLYSYENETIVSNQIKLIDTGISIKVPEGTYGRIAPRSSVSKRGILINAGVIDRDYRGPVKIMIHNLSNNIYVINKNDRIAQLILEQIKTPEVELVENLDETIRGEGGFGSTGR
tara:strand:+ start:122 stop:544 length:423 start_codon:yes stop_codon:yes gene_type:complete